MSLFLEIIFRSLNLGTCMTKSFLIFITPLLFMSEVHSLDIKANLWEKEICSNGQVCLPRAIGSAQSFSIPEPANNSFSRLNTRLADYSVTFTLTKRTDPVGYYSFQVEIGNEEYPLLAICSRFEGLDTMENAMVGACAAKIPFKNKLIGVSLQLPH